MFDVSHPFSYMADKPRFIHFVVNDKFIPDSIKCFLDAGLTTNKFYYLTENPKVDGFLGNTVIECVNIQQVSVVIDNLKCDDVVVLHCLYALPAKLICKIPQSIRVIWYAWGFDLYGNEYPIRPLLDVGEEKLKPMTKSKVRRLIWLKDALRKYRVITETKGYLTKSASAQYQAIARVDYFAGVFASEHKLLQDNCSFFHAKRITHNYIHPEEFSSKDIDKQQSITGNNVLLGNSASFLCNHIDILHALYKQTREHNYDIFCPLSYGGNSFYVNSVVKEGKRLFGERFIPLLDYLPLDEYTKIIQSCGSIVLGYQRQAATCNCLTSMWNGLKVFLPATSMNYKEYKNVEGLKVFSIEDDLDDMSLRLSMESDLKKQREIISSLYSFERWIEDLKDSLNIIMSR